MVAVFHHPPYLPHLAPADSCLFPKLWFALKGLHLQFITEIQDAVTRVLNSIWKEAFLEGTKKSLQKCKYICKSRRSVCWKIIFQYLLFFSQLLSSNFQDNCCIRMVYFQLNTFPFTKKKVFKGVLSRTTAVTRLR